MSFQDMINKQKSQQNQVETLINAGQQEKPSHGNNNEILWKPQVDKAGNSLSVIRFLPAPDTDIPWAKFYTHAFKSDSGKWFIENCPTSIGKDCPCCVANSELWNSGLDENKDIVRKRKRNLHYISNILVIKDGINPENNGKILQYKYGAKIFAKLMEAMQPSFEDETPVNPFNLFSGANFRLKIKQVAGYWNYDSSEFDSPSALYDGDEDELKKMYDALEPIGVYTAPESYKSFDDIQRKLNDVLGIPQKTSASIGGEEYHRQQQQQPSAASQPSPGKSAAPSSPSSSEEDDNSDDMDYFRKLAQEAGM